MNSPSLPVLSRPPSADLAKRILLVDDDEVVREFVAHILESAGYEVLQAASATEAIRTALESHPHMIVVDVVMDGGDGYSALDRLRKEPLTAQTPVVLMTASADLAGMRHGMNLGADDYLPKPLSAEALLQCVSTQLKKQELTRRQMEGELEALRSNITLALPHEFNTPLNGIIASAQMLKDDAPHLDPDTVSELARCILVSGNRLYRVAHNFLVYTESVMAANDAGLLARWRNARTQNAAELVRTLATGIAEGHDRVGDLRLELEPAAEVRMNEAHWQKVVEEIVQNAFSFSRPGSEVRVRLEVQGPRTSLTIVDRGRGMTPEQVARVGAYVQFDRKRHAQEGLGLGLTIARRLVELHHGTLYLESTPAVGTIVTLELPH